MLEFAGTQPQPNATSPPTPWSDSLPGSEERASSYAGRLDINSIPLRRDREMLNRRRIAFRLSRIEIEKRKTFRGELFKMTIPIGRVRFFVGNSLQVE